MKNKRLKVAMFDLDGTLLMDDKSISPFTAKKLNNFADEGIILGIATGRPLSAIEKKIEMMGLDKAISLVVANNGSSIKNRITGKVEVIHYLPKEGINEVIKLFSNTNAQLVFCSEDTAYSNTDCEYLHIISRNNYLDKKIIDFKDLPLEIPKGGIYFKEEYAFELMKKFKEEYNYAEMPGFASGKYSVEFAHKSTNKGLAFEKLLKQMNISLDEVMSFGDADNDKSILSRVGYPIAMSNGSEEIKNLCLDTTTYDNNHDGVVRYLMDHKDLFIRKKDYSKIVVILGIIGGLLFVLSETLFKFFPNISIIIQLISRIIIFGILLTGIILHNKSSKNA